MRIDLHTHSTASDGTDSPAQLVRAAAAAGLDVVALTDHDTIAGLGEAEAALPGGLTLVPGAEISCQVPDPAGGSPITLHLLAYLFDRADEPLLAALHEVRHDRVRRARVMTERLVEAGYPISWEQVRRQAAGSSAVPGAVPGAPRGTIGRPHLADALVESGAMRDRDQAFATVLASSSPFYEPHHALDPVRAVRMVAAAGGVTVVAHVGAAARGRVVGEETIVAMVEAGMAGIEVDHRDHDEPTRARLRALAGELGVLVTGSSDYHGTGKVNRLGENTTDPAVYEALVAAARHAPVRP